MKIFCIAIFGFSAANKSEELGKRFKTEFSENLKENVKYYTKSSGKGQNKKYERLNETNQLPFALSLTANDFDLAFDYCDSNNDERISVNWEIPTCTLKAIKLMNEEMSEQTQLPKLGTRARKKFDFDNDQYLSRSEFASSCAVLNKSFAQTIISIFDGIDGSQPDGVLNGIGEVIAFGGMMSKFYKDVGKNESRNLLNSINVDGKLQADIQEITEIEIQDFIQKLMNSALLAIED
ncbi:unnamed protein product [Oikopleura dioica]|uniref:EF-hand domain-containing protein n=1 Tax=Oikopleura dioica TaxID=34765 RepID=E4XLH0_OIKDI|nr:unnamed protein product [Oikopleura dioica]